MAYFLGAERPLPERAQRDIGTVLDHVDGLTALLEAMAQQKPDVATSSILAEIAQRLSLDEDVVRRLILALENINEIRQTIPETDRLISTLQKRVSKDISEKLEQKKSNLAKILDVYNGDHPIMITLKAEKLAYLHENLYQDAEIITDVRPVFDVAATAVKEMVITHSLVLNSYSYPGDGKRTHYAMDGFDVIRLRDACERAIKKANALKEALGGEQWTVKVLNENEP